MEGPQRGGDGSPQSDSVNHVLAAAGLGRGVTGSRWTHPGGPKWRHRSESRLNHPAGCPSAAGPWPGPPCRFPDLHWGQVALRNQGYLPFRWARVSVSKAAPAQDLSVGPHPSVFAPRSLPAHFGWLSLPQPLPSQCPTCPPQRSCKLGTGGLWGDLSWRSRSPKVGGVPSRGRSGGQRGPALRYSLPAIWGPSEHSGGGPGGEEEGGGGEPRAKGVIGGDPQT